MMHSPLHAYLLAHAIYHTILSVLNIRLLVAQHIISSHSKCIASWLALSCMHLPMSASQSQWQDKEGHAYPTCKSKLPAAGIAS